MNPELKFFKSTEIQVDKTKKILELIHRYEYVDGEMLILFIAFVRFHLEFYNVVWSSIFIKDRKLIEMSTKKSHWIEEDTIWR